MGVEEDFASKTTPKTYSAVVTTTAANTTNSIPTVNYVQKETTTTLFPAKHICFGVAVVVVTNPKSGAAAQVYAFHDSGSTMSLLRLSVADKLGPIGIKYIQKCKGFMISKDLQMDSTSIHV